MFKRLILWEGEGEMYLESHICCFINKLSSSQWWIHCSFPFPHNNWLVNNQLDKLIVVFHVSQNSKVWFFTLSNSMSILFMNPYRVPYNIFLGGELGKKKKKVVGLWLIQRICLGKKYFEEKTFEIARFKLWVLTSSYMSQNNNRVPKKF